MGLQNTGVSNDKVNPCMGRMGLLFCIRKEQIQAGNDQRIEKYRGCAADLRSTIQGHHPIEVGTIQNSAGKGGKTVSGESAKTVIGDQNGCQIQKEKKDFKAFFDRIFT